MHPICVQDSIFKMSSMSPVYAYINLCIYVSACTYVNDDPLYSKCKSSHWVKVISYRNWYQDWGHCGVTNDLGSSPQPKAKPEGCGELPRLLVTPKWPKSRYQFLFYHDASKQIKFMQIRVYISRKSLIKLLQISHYGKHGLRPLSQQLP